MSLTKQEAISKLVMLTPLTEMDFRGLLECSDEEREWLIGSYARSGIMPTKSAWDVVVAILGLVVELAPIVGGLTGAITGAYAVGKI